MNHNNKDQWLSIRGVKDIQDSIEHGCDWPVDTAWLRSSEYHDVDAKFKKCAACLGTLGDSISSLCPIDHDLHLNVMCKI